MPPRKRQNDNTSNPKSPVKSPRKKGSSTKPTTRSTLGGTFSFEKGGSGASGGQLKPLTHFVKPLVSAPVARSDSATSSTPPSSLPRFSLSDLEKKKTPDVSQPASFDDRLWLAKHEPQTPEALAVHKKKVEDVRLWLGEALTGGPSGKLKKYRRILALTGPAGTAKTATLRVLAKELDFDIVEWSNSVDDNFGSEDYEDYESLSAKFSNFLDRAGAYRSLSFATRPSASSPTSSLSQPEKQPPRPQRKQVILIEDLPNIAHSATKEAFHDALTSFATSEDPPSCPLILIISDTGVRGEGSEDLNGKFGRKHDAVDVRTVVPPDVLHSPYLTQIAFNPIANTLLRKALTTILDKEFSPASGSSNSSKRKPSKDTIELVVESSNGDIRSALMGLQFACIIQLPGAKTKKGKGKASDKTVHGLMEAVTRREQSLALFHLLGKILYNKRYGDREDESDAEPPYKVPSLPKHLRKEHARRFSRVDTNVLYADTPVDTSLLSLYVHQNYTQFCTEVEQCEGVMEALSLADTVGSSEEMIGSLSALTPHAFHLMTLGTLHALPSPVPRKGQKNYKPAWFDVLKRTREAEGAVGDTQRWLEGRWTNDVVVCELGGCLKAFNSGILSDLAADIDLGPPPESHRLFSHLPFDQRSRGPTAFTAEDDTQPPGECDDDDDAMEERLAKRAREAALLAKQAKKAEPGWLEDDDIEDC